MDEMLEARPRPGLRIAALLGTLRPHQWSKNLLVFVPLVAVHRFAGPESVDAFIAFVAFSLTASSTYVLNDLVDRAADRRHPRKRLRALAAGEVGVAPAVLLAALALALAVAAATRLAPGFIATLAAYGAASVAYSLALKRFALIDVVVLALLYTLRIIAGGFAVEAPVSAWLLAFSMFVFFSLALLKRHTEVAAQGEGSPEALAGRAYRKSDEPILLGLGTASAMVSILVLALYINSEAVTLLYSRPQVLWLLCPLFLYWLARCWVKSARGEMHDDPIVFAVRDPASYAVAVLTLAALWAAV